MTNGTALDLLAKSLEVVGAIFTLMVVPVWSYLKGMTDTLKAHSHALANHQADISELKDNVERLDNLYEHCVGSIERIDGKLDVVLSILQLRKES